MSRGRRVRRFGLVLAPALLMALLATGCATWMSGGQQEVRFESTPPGAEVQVNGAPVGRTPVSVSIDREPKTYVSIRKEGFSEETFWLETRGNGLVWVNFFNLCIGLPTDFYTGAAIIYDPGAYHTTLRPTLASRERLEEWAQDRTLRDFVLLFHAEIGAELASGVYAEYVPALERMAGAGLSRAMLRSLYFDGEAAASSGAPTAAEDAAPVAFARAVVAALASATSARSSDTLSGVGVDSSQE